MKKSLMTIAAALLLVSCSQDELLPDAPDVVGNGKIGANVFVPTTTRGAALNTVDNLIASNNGFDLISYYNLNDTYTLFMGTTNDGIAFKHDGSVWDYANRGEIHFWQDVPDAAVDMKFFAISPAMENLPNTDVTTDGSTSYNIAADEQSITYTVPSVVSEQVDLMFAQKDITDWKSTSDVYRNGVPLNFHHALSQIVFKARIADKEDTDAVPDGKSNYVTAHVNSIAVKNVHGKGTFDMDAASDVLGENHYVDGGLAGVDYINTLWNTSTGTANAAYTVSTLENNTDITWTTAEALTDGEIDGTKTALLLIPQQLYPLDLGNLGNSANQAQVDDATIDLSKGAYLEVNCRVEYTREGANTPAYIVGGAGTFANLYIPINTNWQPGYKYVYTLVFSADSGDPVKAFVDTVDEWNTATGEELPGNGENNENAPGSSAENPIMLTSADALRTLAEEVNAGDSKAGKYYNIPYSNEWIELENWIPIGNENNSFKGYFVGSNTPIQIKSFGTTANTTTEYLGLFGYVGEGGTVERTIVYVSEEQDASTSIVTSDKDELYFGAVAAKNEGTVFQCKAENININITHNKATIGGLVGDNAWGGVIKNSSVIGKIITNGTENIVGGIAGVAGTSVIYSCAHCGAITNNATAENSATGGIVGQIGIAKIVNCASFGSDENQTNYITQGSVNVGGIIGKIGGDSHVYVCYNANTVKGTQNIGGIVGLSYDTGIHACYNVGQIDSETATAGIGQIVGYDKPNTTIDGDFISKSTFFANYYQADNTNSMKGLGTETDKTSSDVTNDSDPTVGTSEVQASSWTEWKTTGQAMNAYINTLTVTDDYAGELYLFTFDLEGISEDSILPLFTMGVQL